MIKRQAIEDALALKRQETDKKKAEEEKLLAAAFAVPEISAAHAKFVELQFEEGMRGSVPASEVAAARKAYSDALLKYGFDESKLGGAPSCPICKDAGVYAGKLCGCVFDKYVTCLAKLCGISLDAPIDFDSVDISKIVDEKQRAQFEKAKNWLKSYSKKLPSVKYRNLVLSGNIGTGKTTLATALARAAVERGKCALILSAYNLNDLFLKCHTSPIAERKYVLQDVMSADLLVIDDLGAEQILRNVTREYLLVLLEERVSKGLCTVVTTNLNAGGILARYHERIYSRLFDSANSMQLVLEGDDIRRTRG